MDGCLRWAADVTRGVCTQVVRGSYRDLGISTSRTLTPHQSSPTAMVDNQSAPQPAPEGGTGGVDACLEVRRISPRVNLIGRELRSKGALAP